MRQTPREFDADFLGETPRRAKARTRHQKKMELVERSTPTRPFHHVPLEADVRISAPVFETEDRGAVARAVSALFPEAEFEPGDSPVLVARARDLSRLAEIIRHSRIRDTAREVLKHASSTDGVIRLRLNKQAASAGRVNFLGGPELLGAIEVEIHGPDPEFLAEELTWIEGESDERLFGTKLKRPLPRHGRRG